ncbi:hypothetical protein [Pseudonocardia lacus]|uniref:hypothetical protein n=1 Tax=Pseudonocardia lacus TaxID=2835865 RepID=UPI001BDCB3F4|nr:hypothetical protein [Pseudonocardia lacus]
MVDQVVVGVGAGDRLVQPGRGGDPPGVVAAEEVAVAGPAEQPVARLRRPEPAQCLDDVHPPPPGAAPGEPQQRGRVPTAAEGVGGQRAERVRQQSDRLDQRDVGGVRAGGEQGQPDEGRAAIGAVPHQPPPGRADPDGVGAERGGGDAVVRVDGHGEVAAGGAEVDRVRVGPGEVRVQDLGDGGAPPLPVRARPLPFAVGRVVGVGLAVAWQRTVRDLPVQPQRVLEQGSRGGGHRRERDSFLPVIRR